MGPGSPAVWSWGSGEAALVFFHALLPAATGRSIAPTARRLAARLGVRVLGIDAPGFGDSPPLADEGYDLDRLARQLGGVADAAAAGPFVVAGHSWGAALAVRVAATRPDRVRGLVLLDGGHFDHADLPDADPAQTVDDTLAEMLEARWFEVDHAGPLPESWAAGLRPTDDGRWTSAADPRAAAAAMTALMRGRSSESYAAVAAAGMPVLLLTATEPEQRRSDNEERTRHLATSVPRLTSHALPASGHDVLRDAPHLVADHLAAWWVDELGAEIKPRAGP